MALRLRSEDVVLLRERAAARQMKSATYASIFIRAHLRALAPLPKEELLALKRVVAELGAIGRNLNQIANSENATTAGPGRDDLRAILTLCEALRNHVKALIKTNLASWEIGHAQADD
ncbi:MAG TPA: hypothetical protein VHK24_13985 [Steroidobacter sp.]|nr:hypothetical protein [Steroidobacter sp.]